ncbi:MAG: pH-response regulator protein palH/rim21 [Geoglossum simile]|nr:MAG: pH-response regulator protein palH/rim21 [Geoglossum simile]
MAPGNHHEFKDFFCMQLTGVDGSHPQCTPFTLPSLGILTVNPTYTITLETNAVFQPECTPASSHAPSQSSIVGVRDPFYASTIPLAYAIAAATVLSYMLFIMLLITPRTFFSTGVGGGGGFLGRRGLIGRSSAGDSIVGVGRRPWLQKLAALTVVVSLTIASADTFRVAEKQYNAGVLDAGALRDEVVEGLEIRIVRVISDAFLWLAQVQTLIRLFPRHKEKVIIKWTGFALIVLDTLFAILNNFISSGKTRPERFVDAIPALSYLFHISLSVLYSAWVVYYSISKSRFAFYHPSMPNMCLVAVLSLSTVMVPVVFFVLDISNPSLAGWGDYVRWVGAAAASVVVWEWVERIEALEREERKDGVLGREIFDGDEMLEATPSSEIGWPGTYRRDNGNSGGGTGGTGPGDGHPQHAVGVGTNWGGMAGVANRFSRSRTTPHNNVPLHTMAIQGQTTTKSQVPPASRYTTLPPTSSTPVSMANSTSAASTVYAIHYHTINGATPPTPGQIPSEDDRRDTMAQEPCTSVAVAHEITNQHGGVDIVESGGSTGEIDPAQGGLGECDKTKTTIVDRTVRWHLVPNPFKRRRDEPPIQVARAVTAFPESPLEGGPPASTDSSSHATGIPRWDLKSKISSFAVAQSERLLEKFHGNEHEIQLPLRIIPAQPRARRFEPANPRRDRVEEISVADEEGENRDEADAHGHSPSIPSKGKGVESLSDSPGLPETRNNGSYLNGVT